LYQSPGRGIPLNVSGPVQPAGVMAKRGLAQLLGLAMTVLAAVEYRTGGGPVTVAWLAIGPLLASLVLRPRTTAVVAGWAMLLGLAVIVSRPGRLSTLPTHLSVLVLLAVFAVANSVLRTAAQRRLRQVRAVARVAQSALLREVPKTLAAGRMAARYVSAAAEARVGGDLLEVVSGEGHPRWLVGDTRGKGLPAVRLANIAATSFRDACAQPGLSLPEIAWVVDLSVTRAAGEEDFATALFAEFDPRGWLELVTCGHPPALRRTAACRP
jgi:phosphoserine phosphatase RsbU/P